MESWTFDDFDEYASAVQDVNLEMMLQKLIFPRWTIRQIEIDGVRIQHGEQGSGDITKGLTRSDGFFLYAPWSNEHHQRSEGTNLAFDSMLVYGPESELHLSSQIDHAWCTIFIPTEQVLEDGDASRFRNKRHIAQKSQQFVRRFREATRSLYEAIEAAPEMAASCTLALAMRGYRDMAAELIFGGQTLATPNMGRPSLCRREIVRRAQALIDSHDHLTISVGDLAAACEVSERTLRSTFQAYFGISPHRYMQLRRIHQIRRDLIATDPESASVAQVLLRNGEWEFGRFAGRYRKAFGELPSETLRRSKGSIR
ncbi:helix-turn-helix transcriptional regulator [Blastopirellula marina]|uniref:HTH araC/xylS-type domain-containing protein n=1 Tax=Blastopirellula marina TaxID=124 RepID=A0A2S8GJA8_9BACT|nr:helix-turn-helix transcriptional regulator [Blastopirellula marina]PQO44519.1 hypothetical protein C5Y93_19115 [Blastopirellula marina]